MSAKIKFLAVVPETLDKEVVYKAFFFCKKSNQLLSIPVNIRIVEFLIKKRVMRFSEEEHTVICLIRSFQVKKVIFTKRFGNYESIFEVKSGYRYKRIRIPFHYGFIMTSLYKIPLEMEKKILNKEGIAITKEMLSDVLINSFGDSFSSVKS